jgi:hypothetical protein
VEDQEAFFLHPSTLDLMGLSSDLILEYGVAVATSSQSMSPLCSGNGHPLAFEGGEPEFRTLEVCWLLIIFDFETYHLGDNELFRGHKVLMEQ